MLVILVHSPLLGPSSWGEVPARLQGRGFACAVPDLRPALAGEPPFYRGLFQTIAAAAHGEDAVAVIGHSRAGPLLPGALEALGSRGRVAVFADARLPHGGESWLATLPPENGTGLLQSAEQGLLPPWDQWFAPEMLSQLLPDAQMRRQLRSELRGVPAALLSEPMPVAQADSAVHRVYLQLSPAYEADADRAEAQGWRVERQIIHHLAPLTHPQRVADALAGCLPGDR